MFKRSMTRRLGEQHIQAILNRGMQHARTFVKSHQTQGTSGSVAQGTFPIRHCLASRSSSQAPPTQPQRPQLLSSRAMASSTSEMVAVGTKLASAMGAIIEVVEEHSTKTGVEANFADLCQQYLPPGLLKKCIELNLIGSTPLGSRTAGSRATGSHTAEVQRCACCSSSCFQYSCVSRCQKFRDRSKSRSGRSNSHAEASCPGLPLPNSTLCGLCTCAATGCMNPTRNRTRFCMFKSCIGTGWLKQLNESGPDKFFVNSMGLHKMDPELPLTLKVVAKISWMVPHIAPSDYLQFFQLMNQLTKGQDLCNVQFLACWVASLLKWPPAVATFQYQLLNDAEPMSTQRIMLAFWVAVKAMNGHTLPDMHDGMTSPSMASSTGLVMNSQWLGLITKETASSCEAESDEVIFLGKCGTRYAVSPTENFVAAEKLMEQWCEMAGDVCLSRETPRDIDAFTNIARKVHEFACKARQMQEGTAGPLNSRRAVSTTSRTSGSGRPEGYNALHFTRAVLSAMDELHWDIPWREAPWNAYQLDLVTCWTPDQTNQLRHIANNSVGAMVDMFSISPLWIACWACFAQHVSDEDLTLILNAGDRALFWVVNDWHRRFRPQDGQNVIDQFSPTVDTFVKRLHKMMKENSDEGSVEGEPMEKKQKIAKGRGRGKGSGRGKKGE